MLKKVKYAVLVFFVLILIGAQSCLYWFVLNNKQSKIYEETQTLIALKKVKKTYTLRIDQDKCFTLLKWKNNHEFYKDGFICDVVSISNDGTDLIIDYIHDKKETEIESKIKKLFDENKDFAQQPQKQKKNTFQLLYTQHKRLKQAPLFYQLIERNSFRISLYQSVDLSPFTPPPLS